MVEGQKASDGQVPLPQILPIRIPAVYECFALYVKKKKHFVDVIKLGLLRWGGYPGLSRGAQCNHKGPSIREAGEPVAKKEMLLQKQKLECWALEMEDGARSQGMPAAPKAGREKETDSSGASRRSTVLLTLGFQSHTSHFRLLTPRNVRW